MKHPRSAHRNANARSTGEVAVCRGGVGGGLFVAEADEAHALVEAFLPDVCYWEAREAEDYSDAQVVKGLGDDFGAVGWHCCVSGVVEVEDGEWWVGGMLVGLHFLLVPEARYI